ncbi:MAG: hypothetical protein H5T61_11170 [Thermoflexales bacterium]|nr:hypothetical protein [Thermoflexales bacterium]
MRFPPGAIAENIRVRYEARKPDRPEDFAVSGGRFVLEAIKISDGQPVREFGAPLEIRVRYDDAGIPHWLEQRLHLYFYNESTATWEMLPSAADVDRNIVTAWTTHFTEFGLLASDGASPCDQAVQLAPAIPSGTAPDLPYTFFSGVAAFDYYTGTRIYLASNPEGTGSLLTYDHARVTASGPGGGTWEHAFNGSPTERKEVSRILFPNAPFSATYSIQTLLWTEAYTTYSSSAYYLSMRDVTPPEIRDASIWPNGEGGYELKVTVVDNCAVASVDLAAASSSGGSASARMGLVGPNRYGAAIDLPRVGYITLTYCHRCLRHCQHLDGYTLGYLLRRPRIRLPQRGLRRPSGHGGRPRQHRLRQLRHPHPGPAPPGHWQHRDPRGARLQRPGRPAKGELHDGGIEPRPLRPRMVLAL